jgi:hypothetical protein
MQTSATPPTCFLRSTSGLTATPAFAKSPHGTRMYVFRNFSAQQIRGFHRQDIALLRVFFFSTPSSSSTNQQQQQPTEVKCVDAKKAVELLAIGIGGYVKLYNIKASAAESGVALVSAESGVRAVQPPANQKENNDSSNDKIVAGLAATHQAQQQPSRWNCLLCNWLNFSSTSVCISCKTGRKQGPVAPDCFFKDLRGPPYTYDTWTCTTCFARKNSHWNDECWKCGKDRPKKKHKKIT